MGCGIWSMHFIGMLAFSPPIPLSYDIPLTIGTLIIAIAISGFALLVASQTQISLPHLSVAAVIMGVGISGMHYTGMAASQFNAKSVCINGGNVDTRWLAVTTGVIAIGVLSITTVLLLLDSSRGRKRTAVGAH